MHQISSMSIKLVTMIIRGVLGDSYFQIHIYLVILLIIYQQKYNNGLRNLLIHATRVERKIATSVVLVANLT